MALRWLCLVALVGCLQPGDVPCGDRTCPANTVCDTVSSKCLTREQDTVCNAGSGIDDGEFCDAGGGLVGICQHHKCLPGCGDGEINQDGEECDDKNFRSHDGCSSECLGESASWVEMPDPWRGVVGHVTGFSTANHSIILFGGLAETGLREEQWIGSSGPAGWQLRQEPTIYPNQTRPPPRVGAVMAYDSVRNRLVMFGGATLSDYYGDTWEWSLNEGWIERTDLTTHPSPRSYAKMVYDTQDNKMVLFGGLAANGEQEDTWELTSSGWTLISPSTYPSARSEHAMAYDEARHVTVLHGGREGTTFFGDVWEYADGAWVQRSSGTIAGLRSGAAMAWAPGAISKIVMVGGYRKSFFGPLPTNDTWTYDGSTWTDVTTGVSPPARAFATLTAVTPTIGPSPLLTLIGGGQADGKPPLADVWQLETDFSWSNLTPHAIPPPRYGAPAAYDDDEDVIHVVGGFSSSIQTDAWNYVEVGWARMPYATSPAQQYPIRYFEALGYDPGRKRLVLFGGLDGAGNATGETYERVGTNAYDWMKITGAGPSARSHGVFAYDGETLVLFGGLAANGTILGETWTYNGTWAQETAANGPPATESPAAAYDPVHHRLVMFDGKGDTWKHEGGQWTRIVPAAVDTPPAREGAAMTFDWQTKRMLLVGGVADVLFTDTWELDDTTWHKVDVRGIGPLPRTFFGLASHKKYRETFLVGGTGAGNLNAFGDVWTLQYRSADAKEEICDNYDDMNQPIDDDGDLHANADDPDCCAYTVPHTCLDF